MTTCSFSLRPSVTSAEISLLMPMICAQLYAPVLLQHPHLDCRAFPRIADGDDRYQQNPLRLCQYDEDLRRHLNLQFTLRIEWRLV